MMEDHCQIKYKLLLKGYALCRRPLFFGAIVGDYFSNHFNTSGTAEPPSQHIIFFSPRLSFGKLSAFFLTLGTPFLQSGSTLGNHFGTSGTPWVALLVSREHLGKQFWHLGTTLEEHGSSRMDTNLQIKGFLLILE